jgi:UDP-2-acetamido-2,6-beta-L-arabino-hexul-4-ose reductase
MKILVTGAKGFVGKNLTVELKNQNFNEIYEYDIDTELSLLDGYCKEADFVYHLAGVNRPKDSSEFMEVNHGFTSFLLDRLNEYNNTCPVMFSSSIQAVLDNPYGRSKKAAEELMFAYERKTGAKVLVYRFPNIFGKWCRPGYNSVIATFCSNISRGLPVTVDDRDKELNLAYIDDVVGELIKVLNSRNWSKEAFCSVSPVYRLTLGEIADLIYSFKKSYENLSVPDMSDEFASRLYSTYLTYLPEDGFGKALKINRDERGSFTELIKTPDRGQISVNISKPGAVKGNHWHQNKSEKFFVVSGRGVINLRKVGCSEIIKKHVSADAPEAIDIPAGYVHSIENTGNTEMVTIIWANECFNPEKPDTYYLEEVKPREKA